MKTILATPAGKAIVCLNLYSTCSVVNRTCRHVHHADVNTLSQDNSDCSIAVQNDNSNVGTSASENLTQSPRSNDCTDCSFIVDPVLLLNFVIALRLKGDVDPI